MESIHSAVFMGVIDDEVLQEYDIYPYGDWKDAAKVSGDVKGVADWLDVFISSHVTRSSRVLVVGAGGGKELIKLRETGCSVTGIEFDQALFAETSTMLLRSVDGAGITLRHAERFNLEGERKDFDIVIVPRFYTSFVQGRPERVRFLKACSERLREGGVIAFDYFTRPESETAPASFLFKFQPPVANFLRLLRGGGKRRIETGDHLDPKVPLLHHHYSHANLDIELSEAGLTAAEQGETWFGWSVAKCPVGGGAAEEPASSLRSTPAAPLPEVSHS
ncbi:class I SAM-dependent methyltransferase [Verrucomicrobiales bacterium BCK34]|nr:class I SAM-dependent methyltransferase [Verrucomicrobiales bacterium BCK34]